MPRLKRVGKRETFSISVSPETRARLRKAADRAFGGNVSALIEAISVEAEREAARKEALQWLLDRGPAIDPKAYEAFLKEMAGPRRRRRPRAA
jgi:hypothetical protein